MPTFHGQTVDIYEDLEDALASPWTEEDPDSILTPNSATAKYAGSYGMLVDMSTGVFDGTIYASFGAVANISYGFWFFTPDLNTGVVCTIAQASIYLDLSWRNDTGDHYFRVVDVTSDSSITCSANTWYWITVKFQRNSTYSVNIYDTATNLIDTLTGTNSDDTINLLRFGNCTSREIEDTMYYDDIVVDYADATFPLLGWDAGGGAAETLRVLTSARWR